MCKGRFYSGCFTAVTIQMRAGSSASLKVTRRMRLWNNFPIEKVEANNQSLNIQGSLWHAKALRSFGWLQRKKTHSSHLCRSCNFWNYFCRIQKKKKLRNERITQCVSRGVSSSCHRFPDAQMLLPYQENYFKNFHSGFYSINHSSVFYNSLNRDFFFSKQRLLI